MKIRIVIAESYLTKRYALSNLFQKTRNTQIVAEYNEGINLLEDLKKIKPDVVILGDKLKDMTIFVLVSKIMLQQPTPILIIGNEDQQMIIDRPEALDYGIVDTVQMKLDRGHFEFPQELIKRTKILFELDLNKYEKRISILNKKLQKKIKLQESLRKRLRINQPKLSTKKKQIRKMVFQKVIIIGASTGGPKMLNYILSQFPPTFPPVIVVQHLPKGFAQIFADRMKQKLQMNIKLAQKGELLRSGHIYIAPGGIHTELDQLKTGRVRLIHTNGPAINYVKPSVDVLLYSAVPIYGKNVICVILTGMGIDGRDGSRFVKNNGGKVIALNEEDSTIYGMNKAVVEAGISEAALGMEGITDAIISIIKSK